MLAEKTSERKEHWRLGIGHHQKGMRQRVIELNLVAYFLRVMLWSGRPCSVSAYSISFLQLTEVGQTSVANPNRQLAAVTLTDAGTAFVKVRRKASPTLVWAVVFSSFMESVNHRRAFSPFEQQATRTRSGADVKCSEAFGRHFVGQAR